MIFGRSGATLLVTLGQILLLSNILQCAHGLVKVPIITRSNKTSVIEKRDDTSDADNSDWVEIPGWSSFLLHVDTCSRISTADEGMDVTKRDFSISESTQSYFAQILDDVLAIVSFLDKRANLELGL